MSVLFPNGTTVSIPPGHPVLKTSEALILADGELLTLPENVRFTVDEFHQYLMIHVYHGVIQEINEYLDNDGNIFDIQNPEVDRIHPTVTSMRVALQMCDEPTVEQCKEVLHGTCQYCESYSAKTILIKAVLREFGNDKTVLMDVLSHFHPGSIYDILGPTSGDSILLSPGAFDGVENPPQYVDGVLLGLDIPQLLINSIEHWVGTHPKDYGDLFKFVVKYIDGDDDMTTEDIRRWAMFCNTPLSNTTAELLLVETLGEFNWQSPIRNSSDMPEVCETLLSLFTLNPAKTPLSVIYPTHRNMYPLMCTPVTCQILESKTTFSQILLISYCCINKTKVSCDPAVSPNILLLHIREYLTNLGLGDIAETYYHDI